MRIDSNQGPQLTAEAGSTSSQSTATASSSAWGVGEDEAQLSGAHVQVEALAAQAAQLPEVRQDRVSSLRQAVESGQYQASPESVAGSMFDHMLAFSVA